MYSFPFPSRARHQREEYLVIATLFFLRLGLCFFPSASPPKRSPYRAEQQAVCAPNDFQLNTIQSDTLAYLTSSMSCGEQWRASSDMGLFLSNHHRHGELSLLLSSPRPGCADRAKPEIYFVHAALHSKPSDLASENLWRRFGGDACEEMTKMSSERR